MACSTVDIARLESIASTLAQGLESLIAEVKRRQDEEYKQLSKYKCIAAQVCGIAPSIFPLSYDEKSRLALDQELPRW